MSSKDSCFICPTHFDEDDLVYHSYETLIEEATIKFEKGHYHCKRWDKDTVVCTYKKCVLNPNNKFKKDKKVICYSRH